MRPRPLRRRSPLALLVSATMVLVALVVPVEHAVAAGDVVVSQVYGGAASVGAVYSNDFIELYNRTDSPVSLEGWSVQYASASGSTWQVTALSGTIAARSYYLVQEGGGSEARPLPAPDAVGTITMSATNGKVALVASTTALTGECPTEFVDLVGYGTANCSEGSAAAPALSSTTAAHRKDNGGQDTDNNASDFVAAGPNPRNASAKTLTVTVAGAGTGTVMSDPPGISCPDRCEAIFSGPVTLSAAPDPRFTLTGWSADGCSPATTCTVAMEADTSVTATFEDVTGPVTTITAGPRGSVTKRRARFAFRADENPATFRCRLDGTVWRTCTSPTLYTKLRLGRHRFEVRAKDAAGNVGPIAVRRWRIV
jgi:hypothetical protein